MSADARPRLDCLRWHPQRIDEWRDQDPRDERCTRRRPSLHAASRRQGARTPDAARLLKAYPGYVVAGSTLVILISLVMQVGPLLTEYAINNGMGGSHFAWWDIDR